MLLQTRLLLVVGSVLLAGFAVLEAFSYQRAHDEELNDALATAEHLRGVMMATRRVYQQQFLASGLPLNEKTLGFLPAHSMTRISGDFGKWDISGISFNNVSDTPRNPANRADAVEMEAIAYFQANRNAESRFVARVDEAGESFFHFSTPIWIEPYCLECHGVPAEAPETIRSTYDTAFDQKAGDLRGILSIKIPAAQLRLRVWRTVAQDFTVHLVVFITAFGLITLLVRRYITHPAAELAAGMDAIARGELDIRIQALDGELAQVGERFNQMAIDLAATEHELTRSNIELERFAQVAAHDLREPLRTITSYMQLIERQHGNHFDGQTREYFAYATTGAQRMSALIEDLIEYARIHRRELDPVPTDMTHLVIGVVKHLEPAIRDAGARIDRGRLPTLVVDPRLMATLFENLIDNALKYRRPNIGPEIQVSAEPAGDNWEFRVRDNGMGIDPQFAERIFSMFQRLHHQEAFTGTGIGLAMCRGIVERHGGRIWVDGEPGRGSTFRFTLPAQAAETVRPSAG